MKSALRGGERWTPRTVENSSLLHESFKKEFGPLLADFLVARGFSNMQEVDGFLNSKLSELPPPHVLKNLTASAELFAEHIRAGKNILVYGDYDVDGMSGLTLAADFFERIQFKNYQVFLPHRFDEGYGVHVSSLKRIRETFPFDLVVTVDSGIGAIAPANYLKEIGVPFIITDHHLPASELPDTPYIVNPNQGTCESGLTYMCGTTVLFFLLAGVKNALQIDVKLDQFLDLVSLATVADQMELKHFNRALVREGLKKWPFRVRPSLQYMATLLKTYEARDLAFSIAPKLNAASRMGQALKALAFLRAKTVEEAKQLYGEVEALNTLRVESQAKVHTEAVEQAVKQVEAGASLLLIQGSDWAEGVLGIVAAKLVEEFNLPTLVITKTPHGTLRGSMRCPSGFHCVSFLEGAKDLLVKFGGHAEAAGMEIEEKKVAAFESYIKGVDFSDQNSQRIVEFDGELEGVPSIRDIELLGKSSPWGRGNSEPLFFYEGLNLRERRVLKERHVKWELGGGSAIGFGFEELCKKLEDLGHTKIDVLVVPEISVFRDRKSAQLKIMRVRASNLSAV